MELGNSTLRDFSSECTQEKKSDISKNDLTTLLLALTHEMLIVEGIVNKIKQLMNYELVPTEEQLENDA